MVLLTLFPHEDAFQAGRPRAPPSVVTCSTAAASLSATGDAPTALLDPVEATSVLEPHTDRQNSFAVDDGYVGLGGGTSHSRYWSSLPESDVRSVAHATSSLASRAAYEREVLRTGGRVQLGICAGDVSEAIRTLKQWVGGLRLPKGLLHGLDVDGVPVEILGPIYVKYSTGGAMTFSEMRESKRGFDSLWRPGDAVLETYDGDFRGVYFNAELQDDVFRQYGVLPLDLFDENKSEN